MRPRTDINDIGGVAFHCQCGGHGVVNFHEEGYAAVTNDPEVDVQVLFKPEAMMQMLRTSRTTLMGE